MVQGIPLDKPLAMDVERLVHKRRENVLLDFRVWTEPKQTAYVVPASDHSNDIACLLDGRR